MNLISGEIDAFCTAEFPDHYAGVAQVGADFEHPQSIVVYRRPLSALDAAVRLQFPQVSTSGGPEPRALEALLAERPFELTTLVPRSALLSSQPCCRVR
jgi:hypothetical protein